MLYAPYICFMMASILCWFSKKSAWIFFGGALAIGLVAGVIHPLALLIVPILAGSLYVIKGDFNAFLKMCAHLGFAALCFLLLFRQIPGIVNFKVFDAIYVGQHCTPFTMYLNIDNGIIAFLLMSMVVPVARTRVEFRQVFVSAGIYGSLCVACLMLAALALGHVTFNPKFPQQTCVFLLNNLLLVCVAEEAFFRGYIQKSLTDICQKYHFSKMFALVLASVLFGLRHYQSGVPMIVLSTIAGLFYGVAYARGNRIEASILVHFGLNATHFFLFSYPSLLR